MRAGKILKFVSNIFCCDRLIKHNLFKVLNITTVLYWYLSFVFLNLQVLKMIFCLCWCNKFYKPS
jgi:hypothetical protein